MDSVIADQNHIDTANILSPLIVCGGSCFEEAHFTDKTGIRIAQDHLTDPFENLKVFVKAIWARGAKLTLRPC